MTRTTHGKDDHDPDRDIARLLGAAGPREEPPEELKERWGAHFRAELAQAKHARQARRWRRALPIGAIAASLLLGLVILNRPHGTDATEIPMQVLAVAGSAQVQATPAARQAATPGLQLSVGAVLETQSRARLGLNWAGFDVRLNENTRLRLMQDGLQLDAGEIYVSSLGQQELLTSVVVVTPIATIRDVGTQFKVRYDDGEVTTAVREGSIVLETSRSRRRVDAAPGARQVLVASADGAVTVSEDTSDWSWIYPVAQRFALEGQTVLDFLRWSTAESGRELRFADEAAELAAAYARFSGAADISSLDPEEAVALVLSTTRFEAAPDGDALVVSRRSE